MTSSGNGVKKLDVVNRDTWALNYYLPFLLKPYALQPYILHVIEAVLKECVYTKERFQIHVSLFF